MNGEWEFVLILPLNELGLFSLSLSIWDTIELDGKGEGYLEMIAVIYLIFDICISITRDFKGFGFSVLIP